MGDKDKIGDSQEVSKNVEKEQRNEIDHIDKRIDVIKHTLYLSYAVLGVFFVCVILDMWFFKKDFYNSTSVIVIVSMVSAAITTLIGGIIGSSLDKKHKKR